MIQFRGLLLLSLTAVAGYVIYSFVSDPDFSLQSADFDNENPRIVYLSILAFLLLASFLSGPLKVREVMRATIFWGVLLVGLVTAYAYRQELTEVGYRVLAALSPGTGITQSDGTIMVIRDTSGHFTIDARVNGKSENFMLDTGASSVVLTYETAQKLGIDPATLAFVLPVKTANGRSIVAPTRLETFEIGDLRIDDVRALVAPEGALEINLLGMSALDKLKGWRIEGDRLILEP
ncbi:MAG: TIGR02281 family clan AA aspartic protease [Rhodobacteraceae bacterium]|nr:TIGR02281 family clan AA aspartic protease [Paracoccaceae bacterium]